VKCYSGDSMRLRNLYSIGHKKRQQGPVRLDRCRYILAQGWPDLHDSRFKNKENFVANNRQIALYLPWLDVTKRRGERHRNLEDFDSISKRSQNHKPGLIHIKWYSRTGNRRARNSGTQRDLLSPKKQERTRVCKALSSSAARQFHSAYQMIKSLLISEIHRIFIQGTTLLIGCEWTLEFLELW
jgi:hypothetical protein